jgi:S1-C subfamily serine protease
MSLLKFISKLIVVSFIVAAVSFMTPHIHNKYMFSVVGDSVVLLRNDFGGGTGFHLKFEGKTYLISNAHVCDAFVEEGFAIAEHGGTDHIVEVVALYDKADLCVLSPLEGATSLSLAGSNPKQGERVQTLGHPLGEPLTMSKGDIIGMDNVEIHTPLLSENEFCSSEVTDIRGTMMWMFTGIEFICIELPLFVLSSNVNYPGNSGSPLVNDLGQVVGVLAMVGTQNRNLSFSVPIDDIKAFLRSL